MTPLMVEGFALRGIFDTHFANIYPELKYDSHDSMKSENTSIRNDSLKIMTLVEALSHLGLECLVKINLKHLLKLYSQTMTF